jgi:thiol-disulfide isomerase/thioredoxin
MRIINKTILLTLIIFSSLPLYSSLEYKKNKHIKLREKYQNFTRVDEISSINQIQDQINSKSNFLIFFYSFYCVHCKELYETLNTVSSYKFTDSFNFLRIDCGKSENKQICIHYEIFHYPTLKVYVKGEETDSLPNERNLETLLEYIDKVLSPAVIQLGSNKKIKKFSEEYGDNSFLLVVDGDHHYHDFDIKECYKKIAEDKEYKPLFYFFSIKKKKFKNENEIKLPAVIVYILLYN